MSDQLKPPNNVHDIQMIQRFASTWKATIGGMDNVLAYFQVAKTKLVELNRYYGARLEHCLFLRQEIAECVSFLRASSPRATLEQRKTNYSKIMQYGQILRVYNREMFVLCQTQLKQINLLNMHAEDRLLHKRNEKLILVDCRKTLTGRLEAWPLMCEILDCEQMVADMIANLTNFSVYFEQTYKDMNRMIDDTQLALNAALDDVFTIAKNGTNIGV